MKSLTPTCFALMLMLFCASCNKVIDVKLDDSVSQVIIEGEITNNKGPYTITVTESVNFGETNNFPGRDDATVIIQDLTGSTTETLTSKGDGTYQTAKLLGVAGHTYQLTVTLDSKLYTATSTIPLKAVKLDRIYAKKFALDNDQVFMVPVFTDPAGKGNYYRIRQWINDVPIKGSFTISDEAADGLKNNAQLFYSTDAADGNPLINNGDTMTAELQCIDQEAYDYFRTLGTTIDQNAATPSNPLTNFTGGAMGVFNACRSVKLSAKAKF
jgi:hypothetical protein